MGPLELLLPDSVRVVFLDMDQTLVGADSDLSWKRFLISHGLCGLGDRPVACFTLA